jgi:hypothetical protein
MQAATCEPVLTERVASNLLPLDTLAATIKARVVKGDKATSDAEGHYLAAGLLLLEAKRRLPLEQPGLRWSAYVYGTCKIGTTRANELIAIAEERTTVEAQREKNRNRQAAFAAKNKTARSNVTNVLPSTDPLSEQRNIVTNAMRDLNLSDLTLLAQYATRLVDLSQEWTNQAELAIKKTDEEVPSHQTTAIKWRVNHSPAKTVYTRQCHDILTLTYPTGAPIHPDDADFVACADKREDVPEHWALWGCWENINWVQSTHDTKDAARAALRANRLSPPNPPKYTIIDSSIAACTTRH